MINLILCGGSGTRLWPLSRTLFPKQFVRIFDNQSLFQKTCLRNQLLCDQSLIISNVDQYFLAVDQLAETNTSSASFLLEPVGRNTAPAIALACLGLNEEDVVLVTPSDHLIRDQQAYQDAVRKAEKMALQGHLVTFGIQPDYPETGFGYIEAKGDHVLSFKEKPDAESAQAYIDQGNYYWNSGMFCFQAGVFLQELQAYAPEVYQACVDALVPEEAGEIRIQHDLMSQIPDISIDYAVMEKSQKVRVVPCEIGWSDLGCYDALFTELSQESSDNAILEMQRADMTPLCLDAKNNLVVTENRQVALVDVDDLIVVDTSDALLISKRDSSQKVKQVVSQLKQVKPELTEVHRLVHRPWGSYEVLIDSDQYKVKRLVVKPGRKLSLQKHFHRNEHWVVVSGTATVTVDERTFLVRPNESTYIQMGQVHRLYNEGKIDLVIIEVQVGEYTGEDDIVRLDDIYQRK